MIKIWNILFLFAAQRARVLTRVLASTIETDIIHRIGAKYESVQVNVPDGGNLSETDMKQRHLALENLTTRSFTECIDREYSADECQTYIEAILQGAVGFDVGSVQVKIHAPRTPEVFAESYWMVEVPVSIHGDFACDRNGGETYYPYLWTTPDGTQLNVKNTDCRGKSTAECCLALHEYGRTSIEEGGLGGRDTNGRCLSCFAYQETLIPTIDDSTGVVEYIDYEIADDGSCVQKSLSSVRVVEFDHRTDFLIQLAKGEIMMFSGLPTCEKFQRLLMRLYNAAVLIPPLSMAVGELACSYCYSDDDDDASVSELHYNHPTMLKLRELLDFNTTPSTEKSIIIYTNESGEIVNVPKLG